MNSGVAFGLLLATTVAWVLVPLAPALRELLRPTDATPLGQVGGDAGDLSVFADGFRRFASRAPTAGHATDIVRLNGHDGALRDVTSADGTIGAVVIAPGPLQLAHGETFAQEVWAQGTIHAGAHTTFRALLAEHDAELGIETQVMRWLHGERNVTVGHDSTLHGRASAGGTLRLGMGVRFGRLRAARIVVGRDEFPVPAPLPPPVSGTMRLPRTARQERGFIRVEGDLEVPSGATVVGRLVVHGVVRIGEGARVSGDIKAHGDCLVGPDAVVDGAITSRRNVVLEDGALVQGPVVAEERCAVARGAMVGRPQSPSTVAARIVTLDEGVQVFGAVSAQLEGTTGIRHVGDELRRAERGIRG